MMFTRVTEVRLPPLIFTLVFEASMLSASVLEPTSKIVLNLFIDQDNLKNCLWTSYLTWPQMENFEASPVASNFSIVLKPTSKIVLNLYRDQNNHKKLSLDLIFNLSSNRKLRPVKWPLTFQQFESRPQTIFLITYPMSMDLMFNLSSIKL